MHPVIYWIIIIFEILCNLWEEKGNINLIVSKNIVGKIQFD